MSELHTPLAGLGLRTPHIAEVLTRRPAVGWWEVHSENYFGGGEAIAVLEQVRADYPVSLHGVGLGLGSPDELDPVHLAQLKHLVKRIEPVRVSEHLCWNRMHGRFFNDLLPVPRLDGALPLLSRRISQLQDALGRQVLLENVSTYVTFNHEAVTEAELMAELVASTGCAILLDVNNMYVNALNLGLDPIAEMQRLPLHSVAEIHVAGFETLDDCVIDTHGAPVCDAVLTLLEFALQRFGPQPVLLERDTNLPPLADLLTEYRQIAEVVHSAIRHRQVA